MKPGAPSEIRGEFRPIRTNASGISICEHLPLQAQIFDKLAALRTITSPSEEHNDVGVMTGYSHAAVKAAGHPSFGAVVSKVRGMVRGMPAFMSLRGASVGCEPGILGMAHRPFTPSGGAADDLRLPVGVSAERRLEQGQLLRAFDGLRREFDRSGAMSGFDAFQQQAFEIVSSGRIREALSIAREPSHVLERYSGVKQFLKARRLVEAGVGCVTLTVGESWDTHRDNFATLKKLLPMLDRGIAALIQDLSDRGLANDVVTIVWGEFGRTPVINRDAGRDHWTPVMSAMIAGGGFKMGQVIGSTNARGEEPCERRYPVSQVLAMLYRAVGIDPATTFQNNSGRPVHILEDREPIRELI